MKTLFIKFVLTLIFLLLLPQSVYAQEYTVQPILIIPSDWNSRITPELENKYKSAIREGIKEVQKWYADKLEGHTFVLRGDVESRRIKAEIGDPKFIGTNYYESTWGTVRTMYQVYKKLGGLDLVNHGDKVVHIFWFVGSGDIDIVNGGEDFDLSNPEKRFPIAELGHSNIEDLTKPLVSEQRNKALGLIAHEIGHAFGLVRDGFAKGHPCTVGHKHECEMGGLPVCWKSSNELDAEAKRKCEDEAIKLMPSDFEWQQNIMGGWYNFPNTGFTNTIYNPVKRKAYLSSFLNPKKDPGPTPIDHKILENQNRSQNESYCHIYDGDLSGCNSTKSTNVPCGYFICSQSCWPVGTSLEKRCNYKSNRPVPTPLTNQKGVYETPNKLGEITLQQLKTSLTEPITITFNANATCGSDKIALSGLTLDLVSEDPVHPSVPKVFTSGSTDAQGLLSLSYTINDPVPEKSYTLFSRKTFSQGQFSIDPKASNFIKIPNPPASLEVGTNFHLSECPEDLIKPISAPEIEPPSEVQLESVVISSDESFLGSESPLDQGIPQETLVINDPEQATSVDWSPATLNEDGDVFAREIYSDGTVKDYVAEDIEDGDVIKIANVAVQVEKPSRVIQRMDIYPQGQQDLAQALYTIDSGYLNPELDAPDEINFFEIVIYYSDGDSITDTLAVDRADFQSDELTCPAPYEQCGTTAGLDDIDEDGNPIYPANHLYRITPPCNERLEYLKEDLGESEQCQ